MASQARNKVDVGRRVNVRARVLSVLDILAMAALLLLIFVVPAYTTSGESLNSATGTVVTNSGSTTILETNPQALTVVMGIVALSFATVAFTLLTAWLDSAQLRWILMLLLVPLTALAMLGLFSVGIFMAPLVMIGWMVFALRNGTMHRSLQPGSQAHQADPGDSP